MTILYQTTFPTDQDPVGAPFTNFFGGLKVDGGLLQLVAQNVFSGIGDTGRTYPSEYISSVFIDTFDNGDFGPAIYVSSSGCYFTICVNGVDIWLYKYTGGFTQIGSFLGVVYPSTGLKKVGLKITESGVDDVAIDLVINDVEFGSPAIDPDPLPVGYAGITGYSGVWRIAGFESADLNVSTGPTITGTDTASPRYLGSLVISGSGFSAAQGTQEVWVGDTLQTVTAWADDEITVTLDDRGTNPYGAAISVVIKDGGVATSNTFALTEMLPQTGWDYVDVASLAAAGLRITAFPEAAVGDQLPWDTVGGTVTVFNNLTFAVSGGTDEFLCELWDHVDGDWSDAPELQTVGDLSTDLAVSDLLHSHALDSFGLTTGDVIALSELLSGHLLDGGFALLVKATLAVNDLSHSHSLEAANLSSGDVLSLPDSVQAHSLDAVALRTKSTLSVADLSHLHGLEAIALSSGGVLGLAELLQGHSISVVTLKSDSVLQVADLSHAHSVEAAALSAGDMLAIPDSAHAHGLDSVVLRAKSTLVVSDLLHSHSAEVAGLNSGLVLVIADLVHSHAVDGPVLQSRVRLGVADARHLHALEATSLVTGSVSLNVAGLIHVQRLESPSVGNKPRTIAEIIPFVLNNLFDGRVWESATPDDLPRNEAGTILPFCVWTTPGGEAYNYIDQTRPTNVHARVQLHVAHPSAIVAERMIWQAVDALLASAYTVGVYGSPQGTYDAPRKLRGRMLQVSVMFRQ